MWLVFNLLWNLHSLFRTLFNNQSLHSFKDKCDFQKSFIFSVIKKTKSSIWQALWLHPTFLYRQKPQKVWLKTGMFFWEMRMFCQTPFGAFSHLQNRGTSFSSSLFFTPLIQRSPALLSFCFGNCNVSHDAWVLQ